MATFFATALTLEDAVTERVDQAGTIRLSEILQSLSQGGWSRTEIKQTLVQMLNEGELVLTADRHLKKPAIPRNVLR